MNDIFKNFTSVESIKGNKDLHKIAKKIGLEEGDSLVPISTTRKQFINIIERQINYLLEITGEPISKKVLKKELEEIKKIQKKEEKKKERNR